MKTEPLKSNHEEKTSTTVEVGHEIRSGHAAGVEDQTASGQASQAKG
jgi:hypothetical protein